MSETQTNLVEQVQEVTPMQQFFGVHFNPGQDPAVAYIKESFAHGMDFIQERLGERGGVPQFMLDSLAVKMLEAQMLAVKLLTWNNK